MIVPALGLAAGAIMLFKEQFLAFFTGIGAAIVKHPVLATITAIVTAISLISTAIGAATLASERAFKSASKQFETTQSDIQKVSKIKSSMDDMFKSVEKGTTTMESYKSLLGEIASVSPMSAQIVADMKNGIITQKDAWAALNTEMDKYLENQKKTSQLHLSDALNNYQLPDDIKGLKNSVYDEIVERYGKDWDKTNPEQIADTLAKMLEGADTAYLLVDAIKKYNTLYAKNDPSKEFIGSWLDAMWDKDSIGQALFFGEAFDKHSRSAGVKSEEGQAIMLKLLGIVTEDYQGQQALINKEVDKYIDMVISSVNAELTPDQTSFMHDKLFELVSGGDWSVSKEDIGNMGKSLGKALSDIANDFKNSDFYATEEEAVTQNILDAMFGKNSTVYTDVFKTRMQEAVQNLMKSGVMSDTIKEFASGLA